MLTPTQHKIVKGVADYVSKSGGVGPSLQDLCEETGLYKSRGWMCCKVTELVNQGYLVRRSKCARALTVARRVEYEVFNPKTQTLERLPDP